MIIISDSSALIALTKIDRLYLLKQLFNQVIIPQAVFDETVTNAQNKEGVEKIKNADWSVVKQCQDTLQVNQFQVNTKLGLGETEAIILAMELHANLLIIDEMKGKKVAIKNNLKTTGILGILILAKRHGHIKKIKPLVELLTKQGFRVSEKIRQKALKSVNE